MEHLAKFLIENRIINEEDKPLYLYGFHQLCFLVLNVLTTIIIGISSQKLPECITFLLFYIPLRSFSGGYHAKTEFMCYILSSAILCVTLFICTLQLTYSQLIILLIGATIIVILLSPVVSQNKPLRGNEYKRYRIRSISIQILYFAIVFGLICIGKKEVVKIIVITDVIISSLLIGGCFFN